MSVTSYTKRNLSRLPGARASSVWKRNPTWAALPSVSGLQKFAGLYAVFPESPFVAFTVSDAYTVDWGDGTTENFTSGATAYHQYSFSDADLANTDGPVTFQDSGDTVTRTNHGYADGDVVSFATITSTTGISTNTPYYVISATANTFQLSTSPGGAAITLTTDGSGTLLAYKQAVIVITPQAANNLTSINLNVKHNQSGLNQYSSGWLDISVEGANLTTLTISTSGTRNVEHRLLEQFSLTGSNSITSFAGMFYACLSLAEIKSLITDLCTNFSSIFYNCSSLASVPLFNTAAGTNFSSMFRGCTALRSVPLFNTAAGTNFSNMFYACAALRSVPLFNTTAGTDFSSMFRSCAALRSVPLFNTTAGTNFSSMFYGCYSLDSVPLFNTAAGTNFSYMFYACYSLGSVPLFNTAAGTDFSHMFYACYSLGSVPGLNVGAASSSASYTNMFLGCSSSEKIEATGFKYTFSVAGCKLSAAALDALYTNLATVSGQTITVSSNWGTASDTPSIATNKGWTVTGS